MKPPPVHKLILPVMEFTGSMDMLLAISVISRLFLYPDMRKLIAVTLSLKFVMTAF
jgi:hypothetical protein